MIVGIGTDLVDNRRLEGWLGRPGLLARYFTDAEVADVDASAHAAASLAARFAAKEAFAKALGTGFRGLKLREIETRRDAAGRPSLTLTGAARAAVEVRGARVHLSLTHERDYSLAFVVLEV